MTHPPPFEGREPNTHAEGATHAVRLTRIEYDRGHAERCPMLSGVRVLDFTQNLPGPYASFVFASWGAEVVKVEPPSGDPARFVEPYFSMVNRGKRSVVLDLRDPSTRPKVEALARWADVLLEGFRPGVMARHGLGPTDAHNLNPQLIYCSISAFGQESSLREVPAHDLNLQASSGFAHLERDGLGRPRPTNLPLADLTSALATTTSVLAALRARDRSGEGTTLDLALGDVLTSWAHLWSEGVDLTRDLPPADTTRSALGFESLPFSGTVQRSVARLRTRVRRKKLLAFPQYGVYRCRDGYLSLGVVGEPHFLEPLFDAPGLGALGRFSLPRLLMAGPAVRPLIAARLRTRRVDEWLEIFSALGLPVTPVRSPRRGRVRRRRGRALRPPRLGQGPHPRRPRARRRAQEGRTHRGGLHGAPGRGQPDSLVRQPSPTTESEAQSHDSVEDEVRVPIHLQVDDPRVRVGDHDHLREQVVRGPAVLAHRARAELDADALLREPGDERGVGVLGLRGIAASLFAREGRVVQQVVARVTVEDEHEVLVVERDPAIDVGLPHLVGVEERRAHPVAPRIARSLDDGADVVRVAERDVTRRRRERSGGGAGHEQGEQEREGQLELHASEDRSAPNDIQTNI